MSHALHSPRRAALRLAAYLSLTVAALPFQMLFVALRLPQRRSLPRAYHRLCCRLFGLRVSVQGSDAAGGTAPVLYVSNHSSYLDIMVLGAVLDCCFIAKAEVADWPLFGLLARLQRTVFVERRARRSAAQNEMLQSRLAGGDNIVLFAEGTSSDGNRVLPFKSSLFAAIPTAATAGRPAVDIQPVSIIATRLDGLPLGRGLRPLYAWYGEMELPDHLWFFAGLGRITVEVHLHPCLAEADRSDRKSMAKAAQQAVTRGVSASLSGAAPSSNRPQGAISRRSEKSAER